MAQYLYNRKCVSLQRKTRMQATLQERRLKKSAIGNKTKREG